MNSLSDTRRAGDVIKCPACQYPMRKHWSIWEERGWFKYVYDDCEFAI